MSINVCLEKGGMLFFSPWWGGGMQFYHLGMGGGDSTFVFLTPRHCLPPHLSAEIYEQSLMSSLYIERLMCSVSSVGFASWAFTLFIYCLLNKVGALQLGGYVRREILDTATASMLSPPSPEHIIMTQSRARTLSWHQELRKWKKKEQTDTPALVASHWRSVHRRFFWQALSVDKDSWLKAKIVKAAWDP